MDTTAASALQLSQRRRSAPHTSRGPRSTSSHSATSGPLSQRPRTSTEPTLAQSRGLGRPGNRDSGEVISNLIFSLSPITQQSERLFDNLLPEEDSTLRAGAKGQRRSQTSYNNRQAHFRSSSSTLPPLVQEEAAVNRSETRGESAVIRDLFPRASISSTRTLEDFQLKPLPPRAATTRQSMSSRVAPHEPVIDETHVESNGVAADPAETFGNVSVLPGRANSPSMKSEKSAGRRQLAGRSPSRAKSTKSKIKELDAERKKRLSAKMAPRSPNVARGVKVQSPTDTTRTPGGILKNAPALPRTSNLSDDTSLPVRPQLHKYASNSSSRSPSAMGHPEATVPEVSNINGSSGSERDKGKRPDGTRASSRQVVNGLGAEDSASDIASFQTRPNQQRRETSKAAVFRDEEGTTQRIQQLKEQKEQRERREANGNSSFYYDQRPALADISPNGVPTKVGGPDVGAYSSTQTNPDIITSEPAEQENLSGKRPLAQEQSMPANKLVSALTAEPRISSTQKRAFSNLDNYPRPSADIDGYSVADAIDEAVDEYLSNPRLSQKIYHQDTGRCVSYSEVGDPDGYVVICCIGMGTSRFVAAFYDELATTLNLRLITPERPGIGDSEPYVPGEVDTPLGWPDDVRLICQHLNISRFALLAHSAGAIYALATALRMPGNIRGRVHIMAPWIPPSQLMAIGHNEEPVPVAELPLIQRLLKGIPEAWLEAATRVFNMSSITSSLGKSPYAKRRRNTMPNGEKRPNRGETPAPVREAETARSAPVSPNHDEDDDDEDGAKETPPRTPRLRRAASSADTRAETPETSRPTIELDLDMLTEEERIAEYDRRLTAMIWQLATSNANPAVDLLVCLERKQEIGFRYEDITKPVVLHHGTKDTRVSVDNVVWLGENMRRAEVRILTDEGHGLMANARVMYNVLSEMAQDWRDWNAVVKGKRP